MIEQRLTTRLVSYWESIRKDRDVPSIELFNPQAIDNLWLSCLQVGSVRSEGRNQYVYEHVGSDVSEILGKDLVGKRVHAKMMFTPARKMIVKMDELIVDSQVKLLDGNFVDENSKMIKYRSCLLPFGHDKKNITHIIVGISWNIFG